VYEHATAGSVTYDAFAATLYPGYIQLDLSSEVSYFIKVTKAMELETHLLDILRGCPELVRSANMDRSDLLLVRPSSERQSDHRSPALRCAECEPADAPYKFVPSSLVYTGDREADLSQSRLMPNRLSSFTSRLAAAKCSTW
jgi:hypothetical protein